MKKILSISLALVGLLFVGCANSDIPADCLSWFDGCNTCDVADGKIKSCTEMACSEDATEQPRCLQFAGEEPQLED